jgi:hypothetical protein
VGSREVKAPREHEQDVQAGIGRRTLGAHDRFAIEAGRFCQLVDSESAGRAEAGDVMADRAAAVQYPVRTGIGRHPLTLCRSTILCQYQTWD